MADLALCRLEINWDPKRQSGGNDDSLKMLSYVACCFSTARIVLVLRSHDLYVKFVSRT